MVTTKEKLLELKGAGNHVDLATFFDIERQMYKEARLLDNEQMDEWVKTLSDDLIYWMPIRENYLRKHRQAEITPNRVALYDETIEEIKIRLIRNDSGMCWTEDPPTRHTYSISNVEAFETDIENEFEVQSVFTVYRSRFERDDNTLMGRRKDILRRKDNGDFELVGRLILIQQSTLLTKNLNIFF